ncbi:MAG TPA: CRISPR system precrRNA processing endoribonuclease RAMP protein Cas6 [Arachnia sp.]|nr:CRISPR system precrRNA processing endoribonuclease RAMP protein Cas6 [Arachnia sp.]HMT84961.1 CRISPR system precrRNA processing endoribonuclease RAMP protein Cas6 [Arachnia sp.]
MPLPHHLHAAITGWFDHSEHNRTGIDHNDGNKPYTISPVTEEDGTPGVLVTTLDDRAGEVMEWISRDRPALRLGRQGEVLVGAPQVVAERSWAQLAEARPPRSGAWDVVFQTPTLFRTGRTANLLPLPGLVLRAAVEALEAHVPGAVPDRSLKVFHHLVLEHIDLTTESYPFRTLTYQGFVGRIRYAADDRRVAEAVAPLFETLPFVGVGSYRTRGLGVVDVAPVQEVERLGAA